MLKNSKGIKYFGILIILGVFISLYISFQNFKENSVPIFEYHRVENINNTYTIKVKAFEKQMKYLHSLNYKSISVKELAQELKKKTPNLKNKMVLTFDDGYVDNLNQAAPIMNKYGYKGTIFVAIKFMAWPGYVTWQDLISLQNKGWEIGSHSWNHIHLDKLNDNQLKKELFDSKLFLETFIPNTFKEVDTFAYPNGIYNEKAIVALKKYGYIAAVSGNRGVNTNNTNLYKLNRINVYQAENDLFKFKLKLKLAQFTSWIKSFS